MKEFKRVIIIGLISIAFLIIPNYIFEAKVATIVSIFGWACCGIYGLYLGLKK